ncbi:MAG: glycyl-radical enzyme activating protein [bacterium]|nr:glycyl-radical enzyme activating protein [bacterium]
MTVTDTSVAGMIFDVQRFSLHDGPGIRTLVFMKGCPLTCAWCSNPESRQTRPEVMYYKGKCIECFSCIAACPNSEVLRQKWPLVLDECEGCGRCVTACYAEARQLIGRRVTVDEVLETVLRDVVFYEESGGGVTVGGGEPTLQADFVTRFLSQCREHSLHTAIETCGFTSWEIFNRVLRQVDLLLLDIKHMDTDRHKALTGVGNEQILANARRAAAGGQDIIIRLPLIPGFNDGTGNLTQLGGFIRDELYPVRRIDILPYHSTGESKSTRLGKAYGLNGASLQSPQEISGVQQILQSHDLDVKIGG